MDTVITSEQHKLSLKKLYAAATFKYVASSAEFWRPCVSVCKSACFSNEKSHLLV